MARLMQPVEKKIASRKARIGVVGLGYVGLPLAVEFASKGYRTLGIDVDPSKVDAVNAGKNYIQDVDDRRLQAAVRKKLLAATRTYDRIPDLDVVFICVPTPFTRSKDPDISYIVDASTAIAKGLRKGQIVILKSTTFPRTTEDYVQPILEQSGLKVGKDFFLAFSPERVDPGNRKWHTRNTPVVVGGVTAESTAVASTVMAAVVDRVIPVSNPRVAEMEKLLENIFRSVNIALVNELALLCDRMGGVNVWEVVEAASTKPFGFMPFFPGPGIGGHCILIDPYYLSWSARQVDFQTNFITLAAETNENMPFYVKNMVIRELARTRASFDEANILILGVAFKRDVDDIRHSPALKVMELLKSEGANRIAYNDPHVASVEVEGQHYVSTDLTKTVLTESDCVIITTDHSSYDYDFIVRHAKKVIDTRNATKRVIKGRHKIVLLGDGR